MLCEVTRYLRLLLYGHVILLLQVIHPALTLRLVFLAWVELQRICDRASGTIQELEMSNSLVQHMRNISARSAIGRQVLACSLMSMLRPSIDHVNQ